MFNTFYGGTPKAYLRLLKPVVYHRHGAFQGYGVKFWPKEVDDFLKKEASMLWLKEYAGPGTHDPTR